MGGTRKGEDSSSVSRILYYLTFLPSSSPGKTDKFPLDGSLIPENNPYIILTLYTTIVLDNRYYYQK